MGTINLTVPQHYGEMTEKQVRYVAALQVAGMPEETIWLKCFTRFAGIKPLCQLKERYYFIKKGIKLPFSLQIDEINYFVKQISWLTQNYSGIAPVHISTKYFPCDKLLRDTVFVQYLDAENFYQAYLHTKQPIFLYKLMATLYQRKGEYNNDISQRQIRKFSRASEEEKLLVIMWMTGIKSYFARKFKYLFEHVSEDDVNDETPPDMYAIIQNQIRMLTDGDITKRSQVLNSNTWNALEEMNQKAKEAKLMAKQNS